MKMTVKLSPDSEGYVGRECPDCKKYFKVKGGTGLPGTPPCHCPYCNHVGASNEFVTEDQVEYAKSVVLNKVSSDFLGMMKKVERRPDPRAFISIGIKVTGKPVPVTRYAEKELEEKVTCSACTLQYTIYGAFGFCPDCGIHNSRQIANTNFDLIIRMLDRAKSAPADVATKTVENALEDAVSCFDGFGREHCSALAFKVSFQNIEAARDRLRKEVGLDIAPQDPATWKFICEQFQKRHLIAHKAGIVDVEFITRTGALPHLLGRKVVVSESEVRTLVDELRCMADRLYQGVLRA